MPGRELEFRKRVFQGVVVLLFLILAGDLFWMTVPRNRYYKGLALENRQVRFRVRAPRGRIFDRRGVLLADNTFIADITISSKQFRKDGRDSTVFHLCQWLELDATSLKVSLDHQVEKGSSRLMLVNNADLAQVVVVEEHRRELPGVRVETRPRRRYLHGPLFSHTIGYVGQIHDAELGTGEPGQEYRGGDMIGRQGIERAFEKPLRGRCGLKLEEVNAAGHRVGRTPVWLQEVVPGKDIYLTLDAALQKAMADAIGDRVACGVALSCRTGEILTAYSNPTFDPNILTVPIGQDEWQSLIQDPGKPFFNRVLQATYPPASLYKTIVSLAALKADLVGYDTELEPCYGGWQFGNRFFRCWNAAGHGRINHSEALVHSCDTFYYQLGLLLGIDQIAVAARSFGLGAVRSGIFSEEVPGLVPDKQWYDKHYGKGKWSRGVVLNNAIGQGEILVTPLQMAIVAGRIAAGSAMPTPKFIAGQQRLDPLPALGFAAEDLAWLRSVLEAVVTRGTGQDAKMEGVTVAGKTGTAQNPHGEDHAWFMCFAPVENPEVALAVIVENAGHGGSQAGPVAKQWLEEYFHGPARTGALEVLSPGQGESP